VYVLDESELQRWSSEIFVRKTINVGDDDESGEGTSKHHTAKK
jgi:hypothetical protein